MAKIVAGNGGNLNSFGEKNKLLNFLFWIIYWGKKRKKKIRVLTLIDMDQKVLCDEVHAIENVMYTLYHFDLMHPNEKPNDVMNIPIKSIKIFQAPIAIW